MNMDAKVNGKEQPPKLQKSGLIGNENGDCLSKMPTATAEQLTLAKILSKPDTDANLRQYVIQLQELTKCSEDQAVTALYDCENNLERAVDLLLDKFRCGIEEEEWHTRVRKRGKTKHSVPPEVPEQVVASSGSSKRPSNRSRKSEKLIDDEKKVVETKTDSPVISPMRNSSAEEVLPGRRVSNHNRNSLVKNKGRGDNGEKHRLPQIEKVSAVPVVVEATSFEHKNQDDSDVWDPYTDCGEWEGEPIEIINSNTLIAMGLQETATLPSDMFQESVSEVEKDDKESLPDSHAFVDTVQVMAKTADAMDGDELFVTVARTKAPPRAFVNMPNVPLFIAPELLPSKSLNWKPTFGDVSFSSVLTQNIPDLTSTNRGPSDGENTITSSTTSRVQNEQVDLGSKQFYSNQVVHPTQPSGFELKSPSSVVMLDGPNKSESKQNVIVPDFQAQCFDEPVVPKPPTSYPSNYKKQSSPMLTSNSSDQGTYLEPTMKNYLLDNMSDGVSKLNVGDSGAQNPKNQTFSMHQSSTQTQSTLTSFPQTQNSSGIPHQMVKLTISNPITHISQTQSMSANSQAHQQQSTLPPGMPHFISQFAPTPYHMFNLPGGSGTGPLFDLDQLQLLQQHRMLYDVHVQHQAATTAQSLLTPNADSTLSGKSLNHNMPTQTGHVTAASTNIRPDMLPPTIGHAPYFPYSGFVLMNGYPNAYLNQQQANSDNPQGQNSGHCGSPITQHQPQQSNASQPYNNLKQLGGNVTKYDDLLEMKYSDGLKQVGFKTNASQPSYGSFQSQGLPMDNVGSKISATHSNSGPINQNYNHTNSGAHTQHFPPQFYPSTPSPYLTVFAAAAAAVSVKQASNNNAAVSANQPNPNSGVVASQSNQMHLNSNPTQGMVLGASNSNLHHHHQRASIPHQH